MRMFVSLGSNVDPELNIVRAVAELRRRLTVLALSRVYRTAPVGDTDQPDFWNLAAEIQSELAPEEVQAKLRAVEEELGRRRDPLRPLGPRSADLDLVMVEGVVGRFGMLELPSPLLASEAFVAVPVAELAPELPHPAVGATLREIAQAAVERSARPPEPIEVELGR